MINRIQQFINSRWILLFIVVVAAVIRLWQIGNVPISPDWDEAALGYDAYSFIHTGRDEYGKFLPTILRSFDDYKPALYAYLIVPFIFLFDVTPLAVRLPSAVIGILSVLAVYYLIKELTHKRGLALLTSALLAVSPWHIHFSRIAFESNVGLGLNIFAALFFLKGLKRPKLLMVSAFYAALSLYVYQSEKVFIPLFMLGFVIIYHKQLFSLARRYLVYAVVVGLLATLPLVISMLLDTRTLLRAKGTSIFQDQTVILQQNIKRLEYDMAHGDVIGYLLDNRRIVYFTIVASGYLSHYNLNWLLSGDIARHHAPDMGLMYHLEIPFLLLGIYLLAVGKFDRKTKAVMFMWFLLAPVPASITTGVPHAVRTLNFLPTFQFFTAIGLVAALSLVNKLTFFSKKFIGISLKFFIFVVLGIAALFNFVYFLNQYFVQQDYYHAMEWQYGYKEAITEMNKITDKYQKIVVSDEQPMDKSYMFFLFYLKYPPAKYQEIGKNTSGGFAEHYAYDKYQFRPIKWSNEVKDRSILYIGRPKDFSGNVNIIKRINYPNGKPAMLLVEG